MPGEQSDRQNCGWWQRLVCQCRSKHPFPFPNSSALVRIVCRKDLRAPWRAPRNGRLRFAPQNLPRKESDNARRQFHRDAVLAWCTTPNKKDVGFYVVLERL